MGYLLLSDCHGEHISQNAIIVLNSDQLCQLQVTVQFEEDHLAM